MDKTRRDEQDAWERSEDVKRKIHRLNLGKRFYLRASQIKVKRNSASIAAARLRNRQLRSALNALREEERCALGSNDLARMQHRVASLQTYHNELLEVAKSKQKLLLERKTDAKMAKIDAQDVLNQNTPPLRKHRDLALQVQHSKSKLGKAHAMDLIYQQRLKPMLDEHTIFDAQVETMARNVTKKHQEFDELMFMYHDATRTRESSRGQLHQTLRENFQVGARYHQLFTKHAKPNNKKIIANLEEAIAHLTTKFRAKNMKELYLVLIEEDRKRIYMNYFKDELKEMVDNLKQGSTSAKNLHEKVIKLKRKVCKPMEPKSKVKALVETQNDNQKDLGNDTRNNIKNTIKAHKEVGVKHKLGKMIKGTQKLIEKIQEGRLYNSENEHVKRILLQLEQKLVHILQGLKKWMEGMKVEKAKEHYARLHRTSIMIKENYEKNHASSNDDESLSTNISHG